MERAKRDRPASDPGGMVCDECSEIFIGADWHSYCAICVEKVSEREAAFSRCSCEKAARSSVVTASQGNQMASDHKEGAGLAAVAAGKANEELINALLTEDSSTLGAFRSRLLNALVEIRRAEEWIIRTNAIAEKIADDEKRS